MEQHLQAPILWSPNVIRCLQVNRSRDIVRQAMRWFPEDEDGLKDMFVRYMSALPKSMVVSPSSQKVI